MVSFATLTIVIAGIVIGLLLGLTGGGGSILTVPLLVYIVGLDAKVAIATSLLVVGLASLAALLQHSRAGNVHWRTGIIFGLAGMAGAYSGGRVAQFIADALLLLLFAGVMIGSGVAMLRKRQRAGGAAAAAHHVVPRNWFKVVADGFVVGIVTGLVGAGGGFLVVPALALLGGLPMHAAVGTSLLVIAMKCFAGLAGYVAHVPIDMQSAAIVGGLAMVGTLLGSRLARSVSGSQLQTGFGLFVLLVAAVLIVIEGSPLLAAALGLDATVVAIALGVIQALAVALFAMRCLAPGAQAHHSH